MSITHLGEQKTPTARVLHQCCGCRYPIEVGQKYTSDTMTRDGDMYTWKQCADCDAVIAAAPKDFWSSRDGVLEEGELQDQVAELRRARGEETDLHACYAGRWVSTRRPRL